MKQINTTDAVGHILCHDMTRVVKDVMKDAAFRKGHIITEEDIPLLLSMGKEHIYVWEIQEGMLHENEGAEILYKICADDNMKPSEVKEGKIEIIAACDGLLTIDTDRLGKINALGEMMIATRHSNFPVKSGDKLAGTRIIPLTIQAEKMELAKKIGGDKPLLTIHPFRKWKTGLISTGSEVYKGRVKDTFTPVIKEKLMEYGVELSEHVTLPDEPEQITKAILQMIENGMELVLCTGGMSVDPDDRTPLAIRNTGADIISYGAPVLPGAMFLLAYKGEVPIVGLPACVMYAKRTIFDLALARLMAGVPISSGDLAVLGHGGLCLNCKDCTYPNCGFGKGV